MTIYEISFKIQHDCPYNSLSQKMPELTFAHWCNNKRDVLEISCDDKDLDTFEDLEKNIRSLESMLSTKILRMTLGARSAQLVTRSCNCREFSTKSKSASVTAHIEKNNCLEMQPVFYKHGWEWYRIIAFKQKDVKTLFAELETFALGFEMISRRSVEDATVKDAFAISVNSLLGGLTAKQSFALLTALSRGYYEIPKRISTDEIAKSLDLPRTTYEEHLRKAESKVMKAVAPLLELANSAGAVSKNNGKLLAATPAANSRSPEPILPRIAF